MYLVLDRGDDPELIKSLEAMKLRGIAVFDDEVYPHEASEKSMAWIESVARGLGMKLGRFLMHLQKTED
jgi:hypothetical protein